MRFAIAGGGVAGLAAGLAVARAGHQAVVVERDLVTPQGSPEGAFDVARRGIPHFQQPHTFLPRGRKVLRSLAPTRCSTPAPRSRTWPRSCPANGSRATRTWSTSGCAAR